MSERSEVLLDRPADLLPDLLTMAGAGEARASRLSAGGDWALRFGGYRQAKVIAVASGSCWLRTEHAPPVLLRPGDAYLLAGGGSYVTGSAPDLSPTEGSVAFSGTRDGVDHYLTPLDRGPAPTAGTSLVGGNFAFDASAGASLLVEALPRGARLGSDVLATLTLLAAEAAAPGSAGAALRWHLTQVLYLQVLRAALSAAPDDGWLAGLRDPQLGAALAGIHRDPAAPWTVARLAAQAGLSRTVFATRFKGRIGLSPMEYLLRRRISGAEADLADGSLTVASVASRWGYGSESAFSAAFKRVTGRTPAAVRLSTSGHGNSASL